MHDPLVVAGGVLALRLVELDPDGMPDVEDQGARLELELPEPHVARQLVVAEGQPLRRPVHRSTRLCTGVTRTSRLRLGGTAAVTATSTRLVAALVIGGPFSLLVAVWLWGGTAELLPQRVLQELLELLEAGSAESLVAVAVVFLPLRLVELLPVLVVPVAELHVQAVQRIVVGEAGSICIELDVLAPDVAFEEARVQHRDGVSHDVPDRDLGVLLVQRREACLAQERTHRHTEVVVEHHHGDLAGPIATLTRRTEQLDLHSTRSGIEVLDDLEALALEGLGVDVSHRLLPFVDERHPHVHTMPQHGRPEVLVNLGLERIEIDQADLLVTGHPGHLDVRAELGLERPGQILGELPPNLGKVGDRLAWDHQLLVLAPDVFLAEGPGQALPLPGGNRAEGVGVALVDGRDQPDAEATELARLLPRLGDAAQCSLELVESGTGAVVGHDHLAAVQIDADEDGRSLVVDAVLDHLQDGLHQAGVAGTEAQESLPSVEIDLGFTRVDLDGASGGATGLGGAAVCHNHHLLPWFERARSEQSALRLLESTNISFAPTNSRSSARCSGVQDQSTNSISGIAALS